MANFNYPDRITSVTVWQAAKAIERGEIGIARARMQALDPHGLWDHESCIGEGVEPPTAKEMLDTLNYWQVECMSPF